MITTGTIFIYAVVVFTLLMIGVGLTFIEFKSVQKEQTQFPERSDQEGNIELLRAADAEKSKSAGSVAS